MSKPTPKGISLEQSLFLEIQIHGNGVGVANRSWRVVIFLSGSSVLMIFAGLPAAMALAGISPVTTLPAPMMLFSPMVTPLHTMALSPIHTLGGKDYRLGGGRWQAPVVDAVPVGIGDVGVAGDHAIVPDDNALGRADPDTGEIST